MALSEATIRRGVRNARYAAIPNHVFEDSRLSMEARWLLSYLLSKPDNWTVVIGDIIKKGNCGRDKARKMIAELVQFGYAEREQTRDDGKFGSSVLVIFDEPSAGIYSGNQEVGGSVAFLPQTDLPATAKPSPDSPSPVKSALSNNSDLANTDSYQQRESACAGPDEDPKKIEKAFDALMIGRHGNPWPKVLGSSRNWALQQFLNLTPDERRLADERRDAYLAACPKFKSGEDKGKPNAVALGVYLRDKMFNYLEAVAPKLVERQRERQAEQERIPVAPFGPIWAGIRMLSVLAKPQEPEMPESVYDAAVNIYETYKRTSPSRAQAYLDARGITTQGGQFFFPDGYFEQEYRRRVKQTGYPEANRLNKLAADRGRETAHPRNAIFADLCEAVPVDSPVFDAWRQFHEERNIPFVPDAGGMRVIYFPKGGPEAIDEFEMAARAALNAERGDDDAA